MKIDINNYAGQITIDRKSCESDLTMTLDQEEIMVKIYSKLFFGLKKTLGIKWDTIALTDQSILISQKHPVTNYRSM